MNEVREEVRRSYAAAARTAAAGTTASCGTGSSSCCGDASVGEGFGAGLYEAEERSGLPDAARLASLGCGNPLAVADLHPGETVLDLGSGGGIDVLLSATRVGPNGKAYGLDMTEEMLALALENKAKADLDNVEFLKGYIEEIPLPANTIDVIISNCVINLSTDKPSVFREMRRVLQPGGRIGISDVVSADELSAEERAERGSYVGCIAGALSFSDYETALKDAGFEHVTITATHEVADGMYSAIVRAINPSITEGRIDLPLAGGSCC